MKVLELSRGLQTSVSRQWESLNMLDQTWAVLHCSLATLVGGLCCDGRGRSRGILVRQLQMIG